jgi:hypothetical protein
MLKSYFVNRRHKMAGLGGALDVHLPQDLPCKNMQQQWDGLQLAKWRRCATRHLLASNISQNPKNQLYNIPTQEYSSYFANMYPDIR